MPGIDAEDAHFLAEEAQLVERKRQTALVGMGLDIGVELRRGEAAADKVARFSLQ